MFIVMNDEMIHTEINGGVYDRLQRQTFYPGAFLNMRCALKVMQGVAIRTTR